MPSILLKRIKGVNWNSKAVRSDNSRRKDTKKETSLLTRKYASVSCLHIRSHPINFSQVFVTGAYRKQMEEVQKFREEEAYEKRFNG